MQPRIRSLTFSLFLVVLLAACNLPGGSETETQDMLATWVAATLSELETASAPPPSSTPGEIALPTLPPTATEPPLPTSTPQNPLVLQTTLCWEGPGAQY